MTKNKILILIACILCACGIIVFMAGIVWIRFDFTRLNQHPMEQKVYTVEETITNLQIDTKNTKIQTQRSPDDKIHIQYAENDLLFYTMEQKDGIFSMKLQNNIKWYQQFIDGIFSGFFNWDTEIILQLPQADMENIKLSTSNAKIMMETAMSVQNCALMTTNGAIETTGITAEEMTLNTSNAEVVLSAVKARSLMVRTSNGKVKVSDSELGEGSIYTSNNQISTAKLKAESISLRTENAKAVMRDTTAAKCVVQTSNGSIQADNVSSDDLSLITSNAAIEGMINGAKADYRIESYTSNASNNLGTQLNGEKKLLAKTSNAKINLDFLQ